ncbi:membrane protein [Streptomyces odonnellii]|uniref:membrane protein n=1 Tax=Streptomyces odonnellii TaxID=1417980 RepID=UPI0006268384|nr:membrane protein [Streptomyces odonnellii]
MHMNSAPHLLSEDRAEFERILDDVLHNAHERPDLAAIGERLNSEQLRTMALKSTARITTAAAAEYEHYRKIREEFRSPSLSASTGSDSVRADSVRADSARPDSVRSGSARSDTARHDSARDSVPTPADAEVPVSGAGFTAIITVLVPVLGGIAAMIFLLVGYLLKALSRPPAFADSLLAVGWFFGAITALGILAAAIGLLVTALRNRKTQLPAEESPSGELPDEVARAREAWRHALLERGVLPFLRDVLADPSADPAAPGPARPAKHLPKIGYSRPDFTSPDEGAATDRRPSFTSPDFTSPDFGGPDHRPE